MADNASTMTARLETDGPGNNQISLLIRPCPQPASRKTVDSKVADVMKALQHRKRGAADIEQHALGEQLPHQPVAACSHGEADGHLLLPSR